MRTPAQDRHFFALFPPYRAVEPIAHPSSFPATPLAARGAALLWNLQAGDWGRGFAAVRERPPGVALFLLLPPSDRMAGLDRLLELMERCRPHSLVPHMEELDPEELVTILRRFPAEFAVEVTEYLNWRGIDLDTDTRRLLRKVFELSGELQTVSGLSRSLYMSRRALGRRFTHRGLPVPSHWLHFGRMLRAAILLQNPYATLHSVAYDLGYPDGFSLSNQMHRLTRLRPSVLRECFGWEWVVEAWLLQEARGGNLSRTLMAGLFPQGISVKLEDQERAIGGGRRPTLKMNVAEKRRPRRRKNLRTDSA